MNDLRPALRAYVTAVLVAGIVAAGVAAAHLPALNGSQLIAIALLFIVATVAQSRPIHVSPKVKVTVEDVATFAALLTLGGPVAMLIGLTSKMAGVPFGTIRNRAFNASKLALSLGAAGLVYAALDDLPDGPLHPLAAIAAALTKFATETSFVEIAVALQLRRTPFTSWWRIHRRDLVFQTALYLLGALAALAMTLSPFAIVLFVVPTAVLLWALRETGRMREQTREAVFRFADMVDQRDPFTHGHSVRVADLAERLARHLRMPAAQVELIRTAARVHDIGKAAVDDHVLLKPGPLTPDEEVVMHEHPRHGAELLAALPEFWEGAELVRAHHERIDGTGYPLGRRGHEIPLEAEVIAITDAYDAMMNDRPYRKAMTWARARAELVAGRGTQWDGTVVDAFVVMIEAARAAQDVTAVTLAPLQASGQHRSPSI